jgi:Domain of unknown function (DUF1844)
MSDATSSGGPTPQAGPGATPDAGVDPVEPIDFATHVISLASSAMVALGQMPAPDALAIEIDLDTARYLIDVIGMLETKTRGNLDESEQKLVQSLLYDLRVAFVDARAAARRP